MKNGRIPAEFESMDALWRNACPIFPDSVYSTACLKKTTWHTHLT